MSRSAVRVRSSALLLLLPKPNPEYRRSIQLVTGRFLTPLKVLGRVTRAEAKHPPARLSALAEVEGVSMKNEAILPRGSVSCVATRGRLLGSDTRVKGSALV